MVFLRRKEHIIKLQAASLKNATVKKHNLLNKQPAITNRDINKNREECFYVK